MREGRQRSDVFISAEIGAVGPIPRHAIGHGCIFTLEAKITVTGDDFLK